MTRDKRISRFDGIQPIPMSVCYFIFDEMIGKINTSYNRYLLPCFVNLKQQQQGGELGYNNVKLRENERWMTVFPPFFVQPLTWRSSTGLEETGSFYRDIKSWLSSKPEKRRRRRRRRRRRSLDGRGERIDRIIRGEV